MFLVLISCNWQEHKPILKKQKNMSINKDNLETLVFGGGCFWCVENCFNMLQGVDKAISGYSGGHKANPTYEEVCTGETNHAEVVEIHYNPKIISYEQLIEVFFFLHNPTQLNRQGNDIGTQYRSIIFYKNNDEKLKAEQAIKQSESTGKWIGQYVTELAPFEKFWPAEDYHQGYYNENPLQPYCSTIVGPKIQKFKDYFGVKGWLKTTE